MVTQTRFDLDEYSLRVLDVVKGKYGLKNRNEALKRFIAEHGEDYVEFEISPEHLAYYDKIVAEHKAKYGKKWKPMTMDELDKLLGLNKK